MMTDAVAPRRATSADVPAIAAVVNGWIDNTDWMPRTDSAETVAGYVEIAFPDRIMWVIGTPAEAYLSLDPETSKVGALYCSTQGKGHGKALMDMAKEGRDFLWLTTEQPNTRAHKFYHREGFAQVGDPILPEPPETVPLLRMEWRR